jgi:hypothetical protein
LTFLFDLSFSFFAVMETETLTPTAVVVEHLPDFGGSCRVTVGKRVGQLLSLHELFGFSVLGQFQNNFTFRLNRWDRNLAPDPSYDLASVRLDARELEPILRGGGVDSHFLTHTSGKDNFRKIPNPIPGPVRQYFSPLMIRLTSSGCRNISGDFLGSTWVRWLSKFLNTVINGETFGEYATRRLRLVTVADFYNCGVLVDIRQLCRYVVAFQMAGESNAYGRRISWENAISCFFETGKQLFPATHKVVGYEGRLDFVETGIVPRDDYYDGPTPALSPARGLPNTVVDVIWGCDDSTGLYRHLGRFEEPHFLDFKGAADVYVGDTV